MSGILTAFAVVSVSIAVGYLLARAGRVDASAERVLNQVAFWAASPALVFMVIAEAPIEDLFSPFLLAYTLATGVTVLLYALLSFLFFRRRVAAVVVGAAASSYTNSNNIGVPMAALVLGSTDLVAPVMLFSLLVLAPMVIATLSIASRARVGVVRAVVANPIIVATVAALAVSATGVELSAVVMEPIYLLAGAAVPVVLLAFGMSLRGGSVLQDPAARAETLVAVGVKLVAMPAIAVAFALLLGLSPDLVLAAAIMAGLPTAQNLYNFAASYGVGATVARDSVLVSTPLSLITLFAIALVGTL